MLTDLNRGDARTDVELPENACDLRLPRALFQYIDPPAHARAVRAGSFSSSDLLGIFCCILSPFQKDPKGPFCRCWSGYCLNLCLAIKGEINEAAETDGCFAGSPESDILCQDHVPKKAARSALIMFWRPCSIQWVSQSRLVSLLPITPNYYFICGRWKFDLYPMMWWLD